MESEVDARGVRYDSAFYPHTVNCMRKACTRTNPQECDCGGNELAKEMNHGSRT
jgi:hypothetical protein